MTSQEFDKIVDERIEYIRNSLQRKAKEYNLEEDRLSVFKRAASIQHQTPSQALLGMLTKHIVSIYDYVETDADFTDEIASEKIGDALNYLILLYALNKEYQAFKQAQNIKENE